MNQKFEPLIPYVTYNKKGDFLDPLLINRFIFLLLGILYVVNFYFDIISYFSSSITFFKEDSICILQQIYYEPDNRNLIRSISIKINNVASFNSSINPIKNNYFNFFNPILKQAI